MRGSCGLILFDDSRARMWEPFSLTRSISTLRFGAMRLGDRARDAMGIPIVEILGEKRLSGVAEPGLPPLNRAGPGSPPGTLVFLSSRAIPDPVDTSELPDRATLVMGGKTVGWVLPGGEKDRIGDLLLTTDPPVLGEVIELSGEVLDWPWTLMGRNAGRLLEDLEAPGPSPRRPASLGNVEVLGDGRLIVGEGIEIEPGVVLDTRTGPIHLGDGVLIRAFTRLEGPAFVGSGSTILGGEISAVTVGRGCKIRGEVADSVIDDFVNKAHEGHLGHAILGRWVNLGAGTTNSDLKNSYGSVRVHHSTGNVDTGLMKVGSFIGDHVKTGIGTLLPTGAVVGAGSNVFGGGMAPLSTPPFTWQGPAGASPYDLDRFLEVARKAMERRGSSLRSVEESSLRGAWKETHGG